MNLLPPGPQRLKLAISGGVRGQLGLWGGSERVLVDGLGKGKILVHWSLNTPTCIQWRWGPNAVVIFPARIPYWGWVYFNIFVNGRGFNCEYKGRGRACLYFPYNRFPITTFEVINSVLYDSILVHWPGQNRIRVFAGVVGTLLEKIRNQPLVLPIPKLGDEPPLPPGGRWAHPPRPREIKLGPKRGLLRGRRYKWPNYV